MFYLDDLTQPVCAYVHEPVRDCARDTAVILCPPFGWDDVSAYRSLRDWAASLAKAGYRSIRFTLPSAGDSGGSPRDPDRLDAWTAAVAAGTRWLLDNGDCRRVAAIGVGLGGLLAYLAAARDAPIDDLVLWATPARARSFVRELGAFAKIEASLFTVPGVEPTTDLRPGEITVAGFLLSSQTREQLDGLDLTALPLRHPSAHRVLLLERDGIAVDRRLREHLEQSGAAVSVAAGPGYAEMTGHPQRARPPREVIDRVTAWLGEASGPGATGSGAPLVQIASIRLRGGGVVRESEFTVPQPFGLLSGILTEPIGAPPSDLCAVLLNAGAVRRIGPSRMWVEAARRWASRGVPTLRLDVEGIGDTEGDAGEYIDDAGLYVRKLVDQVLAALDALQERGVGDRFVLGGLCSGAYWSFHAALEDARVQAALMLNPRLLVWDPSLLEERAAREFRRSVMRLSNWRKVHRVSGRRALAAARVGITSTRRLVRGGRRDELEVAFDRLDSSGKRLMLLFSYDEPLHEELVARGQMRSLEGLRNLMLEYIPVRDHTLRPSWAQRRAHAAMDRALTRELAQGPAAVNFDIERRTDRQRRPPTATR
jgi:alpha-beta hydrolase superfamily lysophospholipase